MKTHPDFVNSLFIFLAEQNSKEAFLRKLQICMKHYDYKDETKDVRGKVRRRG